MICLAAAVLCMLLLLSKAASNLKSLVKDLHWMRRVRSLMDRLARSHAVAKSDSVFDSVYEASMSNYAPSGTAQLGASTFGSKLTAKRYAAAAMRGNGGADTIAADGGESGTTRAGARMWGVLHAQLTRASSIVCLHTA